MNSIIIADEQPLIRYAVCQLLEAQGQQIVAESDNGVAALRQTRDLAPDLLILDLALPRLGGLEVIRRLRQDGNKVPILVLTAQNNEHFAGLCLQAGGTGFIGKQDDLAELGEAVRTVLRGHSYFPSHVLGNVAPQIGLKDEEEQLNSLSARELTVLRYLANGRSNKEIADELALSDRTVSTYKARLQQKLNVDSLAQLLEIAWRQGMLAGIAPQTATGQAVAADLEHAQFHRMFDAMPIPVALRDREGRVLACNRRHLEFHDITQEQAVGMRVFESRVLEPEQALQLHQGYLQSVALAEPYSVEHVLRYREQRIAVRSWGVPVRDTLGELIGMLCSSVDVTEQDREISALTQAREQDKSVRRTRSQFLHDSGEQLIGLLKACLTSMRSLTTQLPANPTLQMAQAQLQSLHDQLQMLLDLVRIERGSLVLLPSAADLALLTVEEVSRFNARQSTAEPCILMQTQATPTFGWVDTRRYRQMLRALCDYALYLGLEDIALRWQVTEQSHAEFLWQLIVEPGPRALVADRLHELNHYELNPHKVFCAQLATLMDGELVLEAPVAGAPLARLCVRLAHALAPANAAVSNRPFSA